MSNDLRALVQKWRALSDVRQTSTLQGVYDAGINEGRRICADELEAALATGEEWVSHGEAIVHPAGAECRRCPPVEEAGGETPPGASDE